MSFLHNEKVFLPLIANALIKHAQQPADSETSIPAVAKKLVSRLSRELSGQPEPLNLSSPAEAELKVDNLYNLNALLNFLSAGQVSLNGARLVYTSDEEAALNEDEKNKLSPISVDTGKDYHVNLKSLIAYVNHMKEKSAAMIAGGDPQGKVLEVMIGKIIDQINEIKPDSGLSRKPKSTPDKPNDIDDEEVIDNFGSKVFDPKNPTADRGSLLLKAKHVKSRAALNSWLQDAPEAQVVMYADNQKQAPIVWTSTEVDRCNVIQVLYARAKYWSEIARTPKEESNFAFYLNQIKTIGPTFSGPNGACTVVPATATKPNENQVGGEQGGQFNAQTLDNIVGSLPLRSQNVNLDRIRGFLAYYAELDPTEANNFIVEHSSLANDLASILVRGVSEKEFSLYSDVETVATWLKDPYKNFNPFCSLLYRVVSNAARAIDSLYSRYADNVGGKAQISNPQAVQRIADQKQVAFNNLNRVAAWKRNSNVVAPVKPSNVQLKY